MFSLRAAVIEMVKESPDTMRYLRPLLEKMAAAPKYRDYVKKKREQGEKPLKEDAWKRKVLQTGEAGEELKKKDEATQAEGVKGVFKRVDKRIQDAFNSITDKHFEKEKGYSAKPIAEAVNKLRKVVKPSEVSKLLKQTEKVYNKATQVHTKERESKDWEGTGAFQKDFEKAQNVWRAVRSLKEDNDEVEAFKKSKPAQGKHVSDQELMRRFLEKAKPETKARMKDMAPAEFMKILGAIMDDDEGGGKTAALRLQIQKLAKEVQSLR